MSKITYCVPSGINATMGRKNRIRAAIIRLHEEWELTPTELIDLFGGRAQHILDEHYDTRHTEAHD